MANSSNSTPPSGRAIPSAGPDFAHLLAQDVVIEQNEEQARTGAQRIEPDHSPRGSASPLQGVPRPGLIAATGTGADVQREVEQFLYAQAELLDGKHWQAWIDLFDPQGVYWMPVTPEQTEWEGSPSIFAEDKLMMEIRKGRVSHPNAWSQAPMWETNHLVSHVAIESTGPRSASARAFTDELRRDSGATARQLPAHAGARCRRRAEDPAAAGRPVQFAGPVRLRAADLGLTDRCHVMDLPLA